MKKYFIKTFFHGYYEVSKDEYDEYRENEWKSSILSKDEYNEMMTKIEE